MLVKSMLHTQAISIQNNISAKNTYQFENNIHNSPIPADL